MTAIAFDDIDAINAQASEEYGEWGDELVVTQEMINQFADLTGDHQWIHVDVERCEKESPFGGPIAHGFLTLSLMPSLISMPVQLTGMKNVVNFGSGGLQFRRPVPAGATLHARSRVVRAEKHLVQIRGRVRERGWCVPRVHAREHFPVREAPRNE